MTEADASARCAAAKLTVLDVRTVGRQVGVTVAAYSVTTETVIKRLGVPVTVSFGDSSGAVTMWFAGEK